MNVDDNPPEFKNITGDIKIYENQVVGTKVVQFEATDADGGALYFFITEGNTNDVFQLDQNSGTLKNFDTFIIQQWQA